MRITCDCSHYKYRLGCYYIGFGCLLGKNYNNDIDDQQNNPPCDR